MAKNEKANIVEEDLQIGNEQPEQAAMRVVDAKNGLNLREGPHKTFKSLGVLADGTTVSSLELPACVVVPGWALVSAGDLTGWAMTQFLKAEE